MPLSMFVALAAGAFLILQFGLIKILRGHRHVDPLRRITTVALISVLKLLRDTALIAAVTYIALASALFLYGSVSGANSDVYVALIRFGRTAAEALSRVATYTGHFVFIVSAAAAAYLLFALKRRSLIEALRRGYDADVLRAERLDPPDPAQAARSPAIEALETELRTVRHQLDAVTTDEPVGSARRSALRRRMKILEQQIATARCWSRLDAVEPAAASPTWLQRITRALGSKGFYADLKTSSKILSWAASATMALALVAVAGDPASESMWQRVLHLGELRVAATRAEVDRAIGSVAQEEDADLASDDQALTADDARAIRYLTAQLNRALVNNPNWYAAVRAPAANETLRREATARAVLEQAAVPATAAEDAIQRGALTPNDRIIVERVTTAAPSADRTKRAVVRERQIRSWFGEQWTSTRLRILDHARSYGQPIEFSDVRGALVDEIIGMALDAPGGDDAFSKLAGEMVQTVSKSPVTEAIEVEYKRAALELKKGVSVDDVLLHARTKPLAFSEGRAEKIALLMRNLDEPALAGRLRAAGSGLRVPPDPDVDVAAARKAASDIATHAAARIEQALPDDVLAALNDYDDHFPARDPSGDPGGSSGDGNTIDARNRRPEPSAHLGVGDGSGPHGGAPYANTARATGIRASEITHRVNVDLGRTLSGAPSTAFRVSRAHSFAMLRGYSRVGGVLIGRPPEHETGDPDVRDLRWDRDGSMLTLRFVMADGRIETLPPVDKSLVHQALVYASDGRPLAATMTVAQPLPDLKILVHPALVDSPLGCRIVEVDRWVDTYARGDDNPQASDEEHRITIHTELYRLAWTARLVELIDVVLPHATDQDYASNLQLRREEVLAEQEQALGFFSGAPGLPSVQSLTDPRTSVLAAKPEFFDRDLVQWIARCVPVAQTASDVATCVAAKAGAAVNDLDRQDIDRWQSEPPEFQLWSGVREVPYDRCGNLACLFKPSAAQDTRLWPLDFMLQVAFTTPPGFLPLGTAAEEYVDAEPFEFPALQSSIRDHVGAAVSADPNLQAMLSDLRLFTLLQRVFRVALAGGLGSAFPMERLVSLTRDSAGGIPYSRTPRWNVKSVLELQMAAFLRRAPSADEMKDAGSIKDAPAAKALAEVRASIDRCLAQLKSAADPRALSTEQWNRACRFDGNFQTLRAACISTQATAICQLANLADASGVIANTRSLRLALKVDRDAVPLGPCPPLASAVDVTSR